MEFMQLLEALRRSIMAQQRAVMEAYGLSFAAMAVLDQIRTEEGITLSEVARRSGMAKSQVSTTVRRPADAGDDRKAARSPGPAPGATLHDGHGPPEVPGGSRADSRPVFTGPGWALRGPDGSDRRRPARPESGARKEPGGEDRAAGAGGQLAGKGSRRDRFPITQQASNRGKSLCGAARRQACTMGPDGGRAADAGADAEGTAHTGTRPGNGVNGHTLPTSARSPSPSAPARRGRPGRRRSAGRAHRRTSACSG